MPAHICEPTENQYIVYFKWMICMVCELYLNETAKINLKKKEQKS